jgi:capsular exopolysaccharide synthesis family protein
MTLEQYWNIITKQWRIVIVCFLFAGLGTFLVSKLMTPIYQSAALVQVSFSSVSSNQAAYNDLLASDQLVQTEAQLATSDPVLREVASHYRGLTVDELSKQVTSTPKLNTQLFEIDVQDASSARAAALANDIATTLIKQQQQVIQQKNEQSQQQIQADLVNTRQQINVVTKEIASLSGQPGKASQLADSQAQLSGLQQHYSQWQSALAQLELTQAQSGNFLLIVQQAQPAPHPIKPNVLLNTAAGFLAGLFLGLLLAVLFVQLDTRVRSAEALSELLKWPVLSTIWISRASRKEQVINPSGRDTNVEAYRMLRSSIGFSGIDKPMRTLLITSAVPRDGKSVVASNLAIFMAKAGKTTLLIDADLRRPTLHEKFSLPRDAKGLSNTVLAFSTSIPGNPSSQQIHGDANLSLDSFVHSVGIPNLLVMPAGMLPPNPTELLESKAMQRFFTALARSNIEVIIFDAPPLLGLSDGSLLASKVDGTLLVTDITRANKKNLKQAQAMLVQAGANVLGCIVNKQRRQRKDMAYSYYYYTDTSGDKESQSTNESDLPALATTPKPSVLSTQQKKSTNVRE